MSRSDNVEYIARISYGKDSMKMLDVIHTRGLPLDRITTTDVWATDTIPAWLPPLQEFRERMDQWIWDKYRIEVEHLCARNKDGSKRTYEQMFYHVPKRRSQFGQVERERETASDPDQSSVSRTCGTRGVKRDSNGMLEKHSQGSINGFPVLGVPWCQSSLKRSAKYREQGTYKGFPGTTTGKWCQKLKICGTGNQGVPIIPEGKWGQVVPGSQDNLCFPVSAR